MRHYQRILFLAISLLIVSCSSTRQTTTVNRNTELEAPLLAGGKSALYKVNIEVFGNFFSGLLLIKKDKEQNGHNIVLMSEVGLTLCEYYSSSNGIELKKASSLFQSEMAQKVLAEDFSLLVNHIDCLKPKKNNVYKSEAGYFYQLNEAGTIIRIKKRRLINGVRAELKDYKTIPTVINYKHTGIRFSMNLKLLKYS
ncbi:hypothetical protein J1N10_00130 [Carboxylicivirga sp. A043]|uniref:hypothetical protein n=1 Tax=Carboxylicivirga litoralis TaxID=2816963 RepID=UPI0021CB04C2|nr:hypothetical protein [Carboxylicivirga sp. A043]MCU4154366.1 hypothetical protein [Carboxylicivirga sp. A043]